MRRRAGADRRLRVANATGNAYVFVCYSPIYFFKNIYFIVWKTRIKFWLLFCLCCSTPLKSPRRRRSSSAAREYVASLIIIFQQKKNTTKHALILIYIVHSTQSYAKGLRRASDQSRFVLFSFKSLLFTHTPTYTYCIQLVRAVRYAAQSRTPHHTLGRRIRRQVRHWVHRCWRCPFICLWLC